MSFGDLGDDRMDQLAALESFGSLGGGRRQAPYPALPPEEAETALGALRRRGLSSLGYVGSVLDKFGGRAVRGSLDALMGHGGSREILSLIPFSDTLGITDPAAIETHRGAQLLKHGLGYDPEAQHGHWGDWMQRNLVGPGVELGLDPSFYLGGISALTKGGQAAAKLGKVPRILQPGYLGALGRGERTLVHGITGRPAVAIAQAGMSGAEQAASAANQLLRRAPRISQAMDVAGEWARESALPHLRSWTDPLSGWIPNREIQQSYRTIKHPQMDVLERGVTGEYAQHRLAEGRLKSQLAAQGHDPEKLDIFLNQAREGITDPRYVDQAFVASLPPEAHALAQQLRVSGAQRPLGLEQGAGLETQALKDLSDYGMRVRNPLYDLGASPAERAAARQAKLLPTTHAAQKARLLGTSGYAGGTEELNALIAQYGGRRPEQIIPHLHGAVAGKEGLAPGALFSVNPNDPWVKEAAGFIGAADKGRLINPKTGKLEPYFVRDPIQMTARRGMLGAEATTSARTITDVLGRTAKPLGHFGPDEARVGVADVLAQAKMDTPQGVLNTANALGIDPHDVLSHRHQTGIQDMHLARRDLLNQHAVPEKTATELTQLLSRGGPPPYELTGLERVGQKILGPTKNALYTMWMSSHIRNATTGKLQALTEAGVMPLSPSYKMGRAILRDPATALNPGIKGVQDAQQLMTEAFADRIIDAHAGELAAKMPEELNVHRFATDPFTPRPGLAKAFGEFGKRLKTGPWVSPIGEKGAGVQLGHAVNTIVENELRLGQYIDMRRRGFARDVARDRVFKTHFDYERGMAPMERRALTNVLTFPTFTRFNVPKQFGLAATHPARISGPLRFAGGRKSEGEEGYVPNYLRGGLNFLLPSVGLPEGTQRYLTSLGTPMEEAFGHIKPGPNAAATLVNQLQDAGGMLRPDIKSLIELTTGVQLHTGRPLKELDAGGLQKLAPYLGQDAVTLLAQGFAASPLSRVGSTLNMLLDPRKATWEGAGLNLGRLTTGVKYSDVDVAKARESDERKMLEAELGRSRNVREGSYFYVPQSKREFLTPQEERLMQLFANVEKKARERRAQTKNAQFGNP